MPYPWPASALSAEDMAVLYRVRESGVPRVPITELIAHAVRLTYAAQTEPRTANPGPHLYVLPSLRKEAA